MQEHRNLTELSSINIRSRNSNNSRNNSNDFNLSLTVKPMLNEGRIEEGGDGGGEGEHELVAAKDKQSHIGDGDTRSARSRQHREKETEGDNNNSSSSSSRNNNERDDVTEYETDEGTERMQLNPSTDLYDDDDDDGDYDDDDIDDDIDDEDDEDEDDDDDDLEPEHLPEAKGLVAPADEEEDMGYDEDDERIAITTMERPKSARTPDDDDFMNEEGSGGGSGGQRGRHRYKYNDRDSRLRLEYMERVHRKEQKFVPESEGNVREGSGNFANDDEDGDDDDDGDGDGGDDGDDDDDNDDGSVGGDRDGGSFFGSKRKSNRRYFRKNTNDAIKIISTPLGKVGIVYQQTPHEGDEKKSPAGDGEKKSTSFTDFDALSPDPESSHRLASSHPKITPVLTPDGKVALLYRGDSESSKYEPIRNLTHKFNNNNNSNNDAKDNNNNKAATNVANSGRDTKATDNDNSSDDDSSSLDLDADIDEDGDGDRDREGGDNDDEGTAHADNAKHDQSQTGSGSLLPAIIAPPTTGSFIIRPTDSVLPMINRPLSEVLGIKKNQFKQFRIKDTPTSTEASARSLSSYDSASSSNGGSSDSTTLHFLTKVNLADYPTSARTRNRDFDFSRDNTMLDERSRHMINVHNNQQQQQEGAQLHDANVNDVQKGHTIANEEVLAKTEVVNLAIIPHFDEELERLQRLREHENRRHYRQRHRQKQSDEELSGIHCIMQAMMGIAAISTVFGMLGTLFKQRILDQLRMMHW